MNHFAELPAQFDKTDPKAVRAAIRAGVITGKTSGLGSNYVQGNLAILPANLALDFMRYCQRNPKPCPLVGVSEIGEPMLENLGEDIDVRTDIPGYNVYRNGELTEQVEQITELWRNDFIAFIIGCSFSFEQALVNEGIPLRHWEQELIVSMYVSNIETTPAGPFRGKTVVSMRPMTPQNAIRAVEVTSCFPHSHGSPIHLGDPAQIGIQDIMSPDWGDPQEFKRGEIPVFWACGVTPQNAIRQAKPEICITHTPGSMLITDLRASLNAQLDN